MFINNKDKPTMLVYDPEKNRINQCISFSHNALRVNGPRRVPGSRLIYILAALAGLFCHAAAVADTHYVALQGTNDSVNGYTNWAGAATEIQRAVDAAAVNDTVLVSNGTYNLTNQIGVTKGITIRSFSEQGHGAHDTIVNGNNYAGKPVTNRCFWLWSDNNEPLILAGFTISNGVACGAASTNGGGGVFVLVKTGGVYNCVVQGNCCSNNINTSGGGGIMIYYKGVVSNCSISFNTNFGTRGYGGGIAAVEGGQVLDCRISENTAYRGGGISIFGIATDFAVSNCTIVNNQANHEGGGVYNSNSRLGYCVISNNVALTNGGGMVVGGGNTLALLAQARNSTIVNNLAANGNGGGVAINSGYGGVLSNCQVTANSSSNGAGGVYANSTDGSCIILDSTIANNLGNGNAGGIYVKGAAAWPQLVRNCLIYGNTNINGDCGGVYLEYTGRAIINPATQPMPVYGLINCTIAGNQSATRGGGIYAQGDSNYIANCIVYSNTTTNDNHDEVYNNTAANTNNYWHTCAPTNLAPAQGNLTDNPLFIDQASRNYRLANNSPCINAGTNQSWMTNYCDLDGLIRIRYGIVDMGAYEHLNRGTVCTVH